MGSHLYGQIVFHCVRMCVRASVYMCVHMCPCVCTVKCTRASVYMCALSVCTMYMCARVCVHAVHVYMTCVLCMCACARVCVHVHCVHMCVLPPVLCPVTHQRTLGSLPCPGRWERCCRERGVRRSCDRVFFFGKILRSGLLTDAGILVVSEEPPYCSPQRLHQLTPPPAAHEPPFPHVLAHTYASSF